ncbi:hypothetical protein P3T73_17595 [Kiritimatiellota bacterium B12222]|nr:hypothetical protein P3T73_17595 [Kiritimatiellota bacterium B12222]
MQLTLREFPVADRWCVHGYYTLCPYAPDGSGRILVAGADVEKNTGEVLILSADGEVLDRFGEETVTPAFWHTGKWQSWSADAKSVYYEAGTHQHPEVVKRDLASGKELRMPGNLEGISPKGEPGVSCAHGMLYAAGYGGGGYQPQLSPIPFEARTQHGLLSLGFEPEVNELRLSTEEILNAHPQVQKLREADGNDHGLTLMTYCVRWSPNGERFLFFFGNHCVDASRKEPRLAYVFTSDREMKDIHLAMDMGFGRRGVHWGWQPDGEYLIGYGPDPETGKLCLAEVRYDGTDYKKLSDHHSGGHPSVSPRDRDLIVTDENAGETGAVLFISRKTGLEIDRVLLPKFIGEKEASGRNPLRVCHHPVFNQAGDRVLCNSLPADGLARMVEIEVGE